ncbi:hypothetical protein COU88_01580 [Candidatus Roizmanbacteria bacterium CG10_big_fil_rev_8_21_14_0_10_39_6]|uniref:Histidine phosphatase family protein n=1 Tax=Candidatus Roizmanbacteria bacterium CG10_big_fil_rev_8_21_14_0_10_39_6 TaxID=1974853 RepID=A0A2M8KT56_9BACT|nr:MAG: hypothetical protein COU88_01580 [Candidatus Roizmanbacteria bacterium CG10_big_fil_rev_8_21_14_0_10_39_6]
MTKPTMFYFVRHGETVWNVQKRIQGHRDIRLNATGRARAHETGKKLLSTVNRIHTIISSDLQRSAQTARIIARYYNVPVTYTSALRERDFGSFAGKTYKQLTQSTFVFHPHIETEQKLHTRVMEYVEATAKKWVGKNILFVTHGGVLRSLLTAMQMLTAQDHHKIHIDNAAYFAISYKDKKYILTTCEGVVFPKEHKSIKDQK